ncbi:hypothetical protein K7E08_09990 [Ligilactobacillus salivarius]|uniref:hypothetical protein n=1 Tax=Ligilactobacillus salivarius TaxID=1624 RepID=UPI001CBF298B|nr:hypothetical protein [Ligilactobacillus salivarius]MBZ4031232.1 hypothetical protein [Ligilactobacillus salivarius]
MKFNIKYPNLIEQAYNQLKKNGFSVTKAQVYKRMLDIGMIEKDGTPTQNALNTGLIESPTNPIRMFKAQYPIFSIVDDKHFKVVDGIVKIDTKGIIQASTYILNNKKDFNNYQIKQARKLLKELEE